MTAGLTLTPAPAVATLRQGSLSASVSAAATVQQEAFRRLSLPHIHTGEQQVT